MHKAFETDALTHISDEQYWSWSCSLGLIFAKIQDQECLYFSKNKTKTVFILARTRPRPNKQDQDQYQDYYRLGLGLALICKTLAVLVLVLVLQKMQDCLFFLFDYNV